MNAIINKTTISVKYIDTTGYIVTMSIDYDPINEREHDNNLTTMICGHKKYNIGDKTFNADDYSGWDDLKHHLIDAEGALYIQPLSLYDHSGISLSLGNKRDFNSGVVGFIYTTYEMIEEYGLDINSSDIVKQVYDIMQDEIARYNCYIQGEIYDINIKTSSGREISNISNVYSIDIDEVIKDELPDAINIKRIYKD